MKKNINFEKSTNLGLFDGKPKIPMYDKLKKRIRFNLAEQYFETQKLLLQIPWNLHNDIQTADFIEELIITYLLIDNIFQITK